MFCDILIGQSTTRNLLTLFSERPDSVTRGEVKLLFGFFTVIEGNKKPFRSNLRSRQSETKLIFIFVAELVGNLTLGDTEPFDRLKPF